MEGQSLATVLEALLADRIGLFRANQKLVVTLVMEAFTRPEIGGILKKNGIARSLTF